MDLYSFLNEIIITLFKHGWNLTTWGILGALFFRLSSVRRIVLRRIPKRFRHEDKQDRLERKVDSLTQTVHVLTQTVYALAAQLGVQGWQEVGASKILTGGPTSLKRPSRLLQVGTFLVNQLRRRKFMQKLKSRKFILAVVSALLIIANDGLDLGIDSQTVLAFAGIVAVWITGEAVVDTAKAKASGFDDTKTH